MLVSNSSSIVCNCFLNFGQKFDLVLYEGGNSSINNTEDYNSICEECLEKYLVLVRLNAYYAAIWKKSDMKDWDATNMEIIVNK